MNDASQPVADRAELYVRSLVPSGHSQQQAATLDRVAGLVEDGAISERRVQVCGQQIPVSVAAARTTVGERLVTRLAAFREWARRNGCSLTPAMDIRTVEDSLVGTHYHAVRLPSILLVEYRDGDLRCVTPHQDGETVYTVEDRLDEVAAGTPTMFEPLQRTTPPASPMTVEADTRDAGTDEASAEGPNLLSQR